MVVGDLPSKFNAFLETVQIAAHSILPFDTNPVPATWHHITKVDPERAKKLPLLYPLYLQHTDAVSIGGSQNVTSQNSEETFTLMEYTATPAFHEPSAARHVTAETLDQAVFMAIPEVLNGDTRSLIGTLGEGVEYIREELAPAIIAEKSPVQLGDRTAAKLADFASYWLLKRAVFEAYIIQNPDSAAAREANVTAADLLDPGQAKQRAMAAERHLGSEIIYLEYSGSFGNDEAVSIIDAVTTGVTWARIWYGGGIDSTERTTRILDAGADAVVVGDAFHEITGHESALCSQATDVFDGPIPRDEVEEWIDTEVALDSAPATRYLSTIPTIRHPARRARHYLSSTVAMWLELQELTAAARVQEISTDQGVRRLLRDRRSEIDHWPSGITDLDRNFAFDLAAAYLHETRGTDGDDVVPLVKLSGMD